MKKLYEAFCTYIDTCKKLNSVLWDAIASPELLELNKKENYFIKNFESTNEFKELVRVVVEYSDIKQNINKDPFEYFEYREVYKSYEGVMHEFFINTGIYDRIISGREFDKDKAFNIFFDELEKKEREVFEYAEAFPLRIEMRKDMVLELGDKFSLLNDLEKYGLDEMTNFVFVFRRSHWPIKFGLPTEVWDYDVLPGGYGVFSVPLFIFNLFFENPVYITKYYKKDTSLFSSDEYKQEESLEYAESKFYNAYNEYVESEHEEEIIEACGGEIEGEKYWELWYQYEEEFINSGKAPINYLKETEIEKFKEFVNKIREFLKSGIYKTKKSSKEYFRVAIHYFLMAHEKPDIADNLVNYVIALEALYFESEVSEMKERLANRIANLLGKTPEEKTEIRKRMLEVYNLRCKYVHGKVTNVSQNFASEEYWLRNILRLSLLSFFSLSKFYDSNKKREELLDSLDSVFDSALIENIQIQASDFLSLARPYDFIHKVDNNDIIEYW